jgi:hypothetical protein
MVLRHFLPFDAFNPKIRQKLDVELKASTVT